MTIFHSYVKLPEGMSTFFSHVFSCKLFEAADGGIFLDLPDALGQLIHTLWAMVRSKTMGEIYIQGWFVKCCLMLFNVV